MTLTLILTIIGGLILGTIVAIINTFISKKAMTSEKSAMALGVNAIRFVLDIAALVLAFFICRLAGLNMIAGLISTAFGLTVVGMLLLIVTTKRVSGEIAEKNRKIMAAKEAEDFTEEETSLPDIKETGAAKEE